MFNNVDQFAHVADLQCWIISTPHKPYYVVSILSYRYFKLSASWFKILHCTKCGLGVQQNYIKKIIKRSGTFMNGLGCKENQVLGLLFEQPLTVVYHPEVILISPAKFYLSQYSLYLYLIIFFVYFPKEKNSKKLHWIYTLGWREALGELDVSPKNITC